MHDDAVQAAARGLIAAGVTDSEIARRLGVPRTTIRDWRAPRYVPRPRTICWRCWRPTRPVAFTPADYAELLGLYLGDGYIGVLPRTQRLRIFLDAKHAMIVSETAELLARTFPHNRVGRLVSRGGGMVVLWIYHQHLSCLFPQVGDGKKHERPIALEPWQDDAVVRAPWAFLRGLIRSDGCVFVNRTGKYEYVSYCFDNMSREIRELFIRTCDQVGVVCRASGRSVRIYQRASVELMRANVGVKS